MNERDRVKTNYKLSLSESNWKQYPDACEFFSDESHGKSQVVLRLLQMFLQKIKNLKGYCDVQDIKSNINYYNYFFSTINFNDEVGSIKDFIYMSYKAYGEMVGADIEDKSFLVYLINNTMDANAVCDCWNNYLKLRNKKDGFENIASGEESKEPVAKKSNEIKKAEEQPIFFDDGIDWGDETKSSDDEDDFSVPSYAKVVAFDEC